MPPARRRAIAVLAVAVALTLAPHVGRAQDPFQVTYTVERGGTARVNGRVINDSSADAFDVYVTAEALDGNGKVLGRGIVFVSSTIPARGAAAFAASIPAAQNAASFRVRVSSYRQGMTQPQAG